MKRDQMLMQSAGAGDGQAFAELVTPYRAELLRFAHRILRDDAGASEEVVQEAMLKAYCALEQGTRPENVRPWLFQIVRNTALNAQRRSQRTCALAEGDDQAGQRTPDDAAEEREWMDWLMTALAELPARQRQALIGRELEGRSHAELAVSLGTSVLAVKTLLHRARGTLRKMRAESMLSVPLIKGRLAGAKVGLSALGQAMFAASVASLIVLAVHTGAVGSVHAAGLPTVRPRAAVSRHRSRSSGSPPPRRLTREQVEREGKHAIKRCASGLSVRGASSKALTYAAGHLSASELEYTDCQRVLTTAALRRAGRPARAGVYFARSSGGLLTEATRRDPLLLRPSTIVVFPHRGWSIHGLHWTSWGASIVRGTGTSVEAQCEPGCTSGPQAGSPSSFLRTSPATVVLSSPGAFNGHTVYRCFRVTATSTVPTSVAGCSGRGRQPKPAVRP